jgi:hypothetical protein
MVVTDDRAETDRYDISAIETAVRGSMQHPSA